MSHRLGLECSDCGVIVASIEAAAEHENEMAETEPDSIHGGWDTVALQPSQNGASR